MARTSYTMFNKNGENGHPCLVPYPKGSTFSFSPLSVMLAVGLAHMAFIILRYSSLSAYFLESFYEQLILNCVKIFCVY